MQAMDSGWPRLSHSEENSPQSYVAQASKMVDGTFDEPSSSNNGLRKRAATACLRCRSRKVRCDVAQHGTPCMKCRMDGNDCTVVRRPTKYRISKKKVQNVHAHPMIQQRLDSNVDLPRSSENDTTPPRLSFDRLTVNPRNQAPMSYRDLGDSINQSTGYLSLPENRRNHSSADLRSCSDYEFLSQIQESAAENHPWLEDQQGLDHLSPMITNSNLESRDLTTLSKTSNVGLFYKTYDINGAEQLSMPPGKYVEHPLIKADDFSHVSPQHIQFLEAQGCFEIPESPALEEFIRRYFIYVHPQLPMIDEAAAWASLQRHNSDHDLDNPISIFTFQAMLFVSCSFLPLIVLRSVGFQSIREARKTLYQRAKLLFDFNGKRDHLSTAQGALLLSYSPDTNNRKTNTLWLNIAIQYARDAGAHMYELGPDMPEAERKRKKKLFWCCILRDRILPLGVRRPLCITDAHFDFTKCTPLNAQDFAKDITCSRVYNAKTKRSHVDLTTSLCELAVILTGAIMAVSPVNDVPVASMDEAEISRNLNLIRKGKSDLVQWFKNANIEFPVPAGLSDTHESVILYIDLMYLYYHAACMALCHRELLLNSKMGYKIQSASLRTNKMELDEALTCMTDIMIELIHLKLINFLPISAVAFIALPLVLNILDVKFSRAKYESVTRQRKLQIFIDAMKTLQLSYDGTDRVSDSIERLTRYLDVNDPAETNNDTTRETQIKEGGLHISKSANSSSRMINSWGDFLVFLPNCYLRVVTTLELATSKGEFPKERDFPPWLQTNQLAHTLHLYQISSGEFQQNIGLNNTENLTTTSPFNGSTITNSVNGDNEQGGARERSTTFTMNGQSPFKNTANENPNGVVQTEAFPETGFDASVWQTSEFNDLQMDSWVFDVLRDFG